MALLIKKGIKFYLRAERELTDPRTQDWFLVSNSWLVVGILVLYNYFVRNLGPRLMKNRKPFDLSNVIIVYNILQISLCAFIVYEALSGAYLNGYSLKCEPVDFSDNPKAIRVARGVWLYYMLKVIDLLDTVFFVLRKKQSQISFLHVYHHSGMVVATHLGAKYLPGGHAVFLGLINSFVHVIMYTYYLITAWSPQLKENIWWKKHITQLQMVQFALLAIQLSMPLIVSDCKYPAWVSVLMVPQNFFMMILFADFYIKAYIKRKPLNKTGKETVENSSKTEKGD